MIEEGGASPLRVHVVTAFGTSARTGGAEKWLLTLLPATDRLQATATVLQEGPLVQELERAGVATTVQPTGPRGPDLLRSAVHLWRRLASERPDVVLGNGVKAQVVAAMAGLLAGVPTVWAKHDHSFDARLALPLGRLSHRVIAAVEELGAPVRRPDLVVIPPAGPEQRPATRERAREHMAGLGLHLDERPTLAMAGRLVPYKGVDDAIVAISHPRAAAWRLVVIGENDHSSPGETRRLQELAQDLGVADRVTWMCPVDQLSHWLSAFDALAVLTKPTEQRGPGKEGFGTVAFEAMVAGVPVVTVDVGAAARRLAGRAGVAVPPGDPEAVSVALARLVSPETRTAMGRAGRELTAGHPGARELAERLAGTLAEVANRPGAGLRGGPAMSVVLPVRDRSTAGASVLHTLIGQLRETDELVVVDHGSADDAPKWIERSAALAPDRVSVLHLSDAPTVAEACNRAIRAARHSFLVVTDACWVPDPGWLAAMRRAFAETPRPDVVAGVHRIHARTAWAQALAAAGEPPLQGRRRDLLGCAWRRLYGQGFDPARPVSRSFGLSRSAVEVLGGFRTDGGPREGLHFSRPVAGTGLRCVLAADAGVTGEGRPGTVPTLRRHYWSGRVDAASGDLWATGRDLTRVLLHTAGPLTSALGWRSGRRVATAIGALLLWPPVRRGLRGPHPVAGALVPAAVVLVDVARAAGCLAGLLPQRGSRRVCGSGRDASEIR